MMKSARVTLTVLAGIGGMTLAQPANPCLPGSFNPDACQSAVRTYPYCDNGVWVSNSRTILTITVSTGLMEGPADPWTAHLRPPAG